MSTWQWPITPASRTHGTAQRYLMGVLPLHPLPGGGPCELRLYLKQWDRTATEPGSWCIDMMKWTAKESGKPVSPYKPFQHIQVSQLDWESFFDAWGDTGAMILRYLRTLSTIVEGLDKALSAD